MEGKIVEDNKNELFSRREVKLEVLGEVVPSKTEAVKEICSNFSCDENLVRIRKIESTFGKSVFMIVADIYDSQEEFNRVVKKTKHEVKAEEEARRAEEERLKAEAEAKKAEEEAKKAEAEKLAEEEKDSEETKEEAKE